MKEELKEIPMGKIVPTEHNPREIVEGDPTILELAKSIEAHGLVQPVVCRPAKGGKYELLAGRRRFEAHKLIHKPTILSVVRDLDDTAALDTIVLENLQREDLDPLTEARSIQMLIDAGRDPKAIATQLGKGYVWVYRRASLCSIVPPLLAKLRKHGKLSGLGAMQLEVIARLPAARQIEISEWKSEWYFNIFDADNSVKDIEEELFGRCGYLRAATWQLGAVGPWGELGGEPVPTCEQCSARTDRTPDLFHDENEKPANVKKNARCLIPNCWEHKTKLYGKANLAHLRSKYGESFLVAGRYEAQNLGLGIRTDFLGKNYIGKEVKEGTRGAKPVLLLDDKQRVGWFQISEDNEGDGTGGKLTLAQKREMHALKHKAWAVDQVAAALKTYDSSGKDEIKVPDLLFLADGSNVTTTISNLVTLVCTFGMEDSNIRDHYDDADAWNWLNKTWACPTETTEEIERRALWEGIVSVLQRRMRYDHWNNAQHAFDEAAQIAVLIGYGNETELLGRAAEAIPEPKCWAKEETSTATSAAKDAADGSPTDICECHHERRDHKPECLRNGFDGRHQCKCKTFRLLENDPTASTPSTETPGEIAPALAPELLDQAKEVLRATRRASLTTLGRRMKIKPHQALQVMEALEAAGIVGPANGNEPREILVDLGEPCDQ
ncbi:MAG: ParB/RepB/Spo0J family partition protein [bacterium]